MCNLPNFLFDSIFYFDSSEFLWNRSFLCDYSYISWLILLTTISWIIKSCNMIYQLGPRPYCSKLVLPRGRWIAINCPRSGDLSTSVRTITVLYNAMVSIWNHGDSFCCPSLKKLHYSVWLPPFAFSHAVVKIELPSGANWEIFEFIYIIRDSLNQVFLHLRGGWFKD